jgi:capsular exopolysaccharide synthesis family protein
MAAAAGLSPADLLRIIRQRLVLILVVWVLFIGLTVAATALMIKYYPKYAAQALIQVESVTPINVMNPLERESVTQEEIERLVSNQCLLVQSPPVLAKAIEDADLRATSWFAEAEQDAKDKNEDPMDLLKDIVYASPVRDSNFFSVASVWKNPKELPVIVNTVVQKYVSEIEDQQKRGIRQADDQLGKVLNVTSTLFEAKRAEIEALLSNEHVLAEGGEGPSERLLTLMALVTELEVEILGRKAYWENLRDTSPEQLPITPDLQALLDQDPALYQLEQRRQQAQEAYRVASDRFGPNHRTTREAKSALESVEERLGEERAVKIVRYQNDQIEQARRSYLEAQNQLLSLRESLGQAREEQRDHDAKYARYLRLLEERDLLRKEYEGLLEQKNMVGAMLRADRTIKIDVRSWAIPPTRRSSPAWSIWLPAGTLLGLVLAVGLAFLLELADTSVRTPRDVHSVPVLGLIPTSDDDEIEIARVETAGVDAPHSVVAEAFRNLRANLFFSAPAEQQGVILVTSPSGGNGKTTIATNLAISIALSGRRVLLLDANFRRGALPRIFPDMKEEGLSNLLIGQSKLADVVTPTAIPGLDVVSSGPIPPNPAELLGGSYLRDVIVEARSQYDQVLFDGPPVLVVSDAIVLAGAVDGVLVVCQYRATSRGALQRTLNQLDAINARVFGAVLNLVESRAGGYFRKIYREFYEYQEPQEEAGLSPTRQLEVPVGQGRLEAAAVAAAAGTVPPATVEDLRPAEPPLTIPPDSTTAIAGPAAGIGEVGDLDINENIDLGVGGVLDDTLGLGPDAVDSIESALPDLDKEIERLKDAPADHSALGASDEFKLEDLDLGGDLPSPEEPLPPPDDKP